MNALGKIKMNDLGKIKMNDLGKIKMNDLGKIKFTWMDSFLCFLLNSSYKGSYTQTNYDFYQ